MYIYIYIYIYVYICIGHTQCSNLQEAQKQDGRNICM